MTKLWPSMYSPSDGAALFLDRLNRDAAPVPVHPDELELTKDMTPDRLREFSASRNMARRALVVLGQLEIAVLSGPAGEPLWQSDVVGSLSHTSFHAGAFVAQRSRFLSVGLDIDDGRPLGEAASEDLMTSAEVEALIRAGIASSTSEAERIIFSAKEALYKCQFSLTGKSDLDFLDVRLQPIGSLGSGLGVEVIVDAPELRALANRFRVFPLVVHGVMATYALASEK